MGENVKDELNENIATRHMTSVFSEKKQAFYNTKNRDIQENREFVTVAEHSQRSNRNFVMRYWISFMYVS